MLVLVCVERSVRFHDAKAQVGSVGGVGAWRGRPRGGGVVRALRRASLTGQLERFSLFADR